MSLSESVSSYLSNSSGHLVTGLEPQVAKSSRGEESNSDSESISNNLQ